MRVYEVLYWFLLIPLLVILVIACAGMSYDDMKKAVDLISGRAVVEASGNMGERDLERVAACGVDIISIGALTHSVKAADISLKFKLV